MDTDGVVLTGRIIKVRHGTRATFSGESGSFPIEHDSILTLALGACVARQDTPAALPSMGGLGASYEMRWYEMKSYLPPEHGGLGACPQ
jgi:hypothetical protein